MRSTARETVYKYLFAKLFNEDADEKFFKTLLSDKELTEEDKEFAQNLKDVVENHKDEIVSAVREIARDYSYERIYSTDKCAIAIGIAEMKYCPEIPKGVAIDEAVKLVAKYSAEKSVSFVNGVLAEYCSRMCGQGEN